MRTNSTGPILKKLLAITLKTVNFVTRVFKKNNP